MTQPLGVVLAGGRGSRMGGGGKAALVYRGRPLIAWPLAALRAVLADVVVVAKAGTELPDVGVPVLIEPDEPFHPAVGLNRALEEGRAIVVCAADLPHVTPEVVAALAIAPPPAMARGNPLLAHYAAGTRFSAEGPLLGQVDAAIVNVPEDALHNVNRPADLA